MHAFQVKAIWNMPLFYIWCFNLKPSKSILSSPWCVFLSMEFVHSPLAKIGRNWQYYVNMVTVCRSSCLVSYAAVQGHCSCVSAPSSTTIILSRTRLYWKATEASCVGLDKICSFLKIGAMDQGLTHYIYTSRLYHQLSRQNQILKW